MKFKNILFLTILCSFSPTMSMSDEDAWNTMHWWNNGTLEYDQSIDNDRSFAINNSPQDLIVSTDTDNDNDPINPDQFYTLKINGCGTSSAGRREIRKIKGSNLNSTIKNYIYGFNVIANIHIEKSSDKK